jgi:hypothetical protein
MRSCLFLATLILIAQSPLDAAVNLVSAGSAWSYFTQGAVPTNWTGPGFDDSTWPSGPAQLGWGEGDEATAIASPDDAPSTVYFRHVFNVTNRFSLFHLTLRVVGDDGVVVYLNGTEVARRNLPLGPITHTTGAVANLETNDNAFAQYGVSAVFIRTNANVANVLAVELHQHPAGTRDGSFDAELLANVPIGLPTIEITRPTDGSIFENGPILFETTNSDPDGHVNQVQFHTNGVFMISAPREPFSLVWTSPPPGRYRVVAKALDNFNYSQVSSPVHVQVGTVATPVRLFRGPYLQSGSSTSMVVRWRTDWPSDSVVRYGTNADDLNRSTTNSVATAEHEVLVVGLQPDTPYYYSIGSSSERFVRASDYRFRTSPTNARPIRMWVIGDSGTANVNATNVSNAYLGFTGAQPTDLWLMLGDNAYGSGTDEEYQRAVFNVYGELLPQAVVWPALGNHDAGDSDFGDTGPYRGIFTLPAHGGSGGVASGSELYYSFDYGNIHFICLEAFTTDRSINGPMLTWLRNDLANTDKDWIIAYWHHPPYSWGSHNSDEDPYQTDMRERALPILEEYGVDLILCGHSHSYERSYLLNGHYGISAELKASMILDGSLGRIDGAGAYCKPSGGLGSHQGAVYVVCGCSGEGGNGDFAMHPAMAVNSGGFGSMVIDVDALRMNVRFLRDEVKIGDYFTIDKSALATNAPYARIEPSPGGVRVSWPTSRPSYSLEQIEALFPAEWFPVPNPIHTVGRRRFVELPTNSPSQYFRLRVEH